MIISFTVRFLCIIMATLKANPLACPLLVNSDNVTTFKIMMYVEARRLSSVITNAWLNLGVRTFLSIVIILFLNYFVSKHTLGSSVNLHIHIDEI